MLGLHNMNTMAQGKAKPSQVTDFLTADQSSFAIEGEQCIALYIRQYKCMYECRKLKNVEHK